MRVSAWGLVAALFLGSVAAAGGCGSSTGSNFSNGGASSGDGGASSGTPGSSGSITGGASSGEAGAGATQSIAITPATATVDVTMTDGVIAAPTPITFHVVDATSQTQLDGASWTLDRGELGTLPAATGVFTASGNLSGVATITATLNGVLATAKVTINLHAISTGANAKSGTGPQTGDTPKGGFNGVGGQVLGPAPASQAIRTALDTNNPADPTKFNVIFPYDKTVFPRGLLPPLVQWTVGAGFQVVGWSVHLKQNGFEFNGYYGAPAGSLTIANAPIDADIWSRITNSNQGDPLLVEVKVTDGTTTYGPFTENWTIAPGILRGTVYYQSYGTLLAAIKQNNKAAAILKINPGDIAPQIAIPGADQDCIVCHEASANGNRLFSDNIDNGDYGYARAYDLTNAAATLQDYKPGFGGLSSDQLIGKLSYSAPFPDGTFFLASSGENFHNWPNPSDLFSVDSYLPIATTGFTDTVKQAVTPAFSPDGSRVAFNFWTAVDPANTMATAGHSLAVMDFDCNKDANGVCGAPPYKFTNLRLLAQDTTAYLGWPTFSADGKWVVYQRSTNGGSGSVLNTSDTGRADLWIASAELAPAFQPMKLCSLNGFGSDCATSYLPTGPQHPQLFVDAADPGDTNLNFEPTITPIVSGGYAWLIFTTRRLYGNVATLQPYAGRDDGNPMPSTPVPKKLWVAAIDLNPTANTDPSHPAFYLPGQELLAGNMRAFWENEPCRQNGTGCETGDECCNGFCRSDSSGALVCGDKPAGCANEFENCKTTADCCGTSLTCIGGKCATPGVK